MHLAYLFCDHKILRFYIPMNDLLKVEILECQQHRPDVIPRILRRQHPQNLYRFEKLLALDVFHYEVKVFFVLEGSVELHDEWMEHLLADLFLFNKSCLHSMSDYFPLRYHLDCVVLLLALNIQVHAVANRAELPSSELADVEEPIKP